MKQIAERFGTPLYVYDAEVIKKRCRELARHFKGAEIHYAVKANAHPALLKVIKREGLGAEAVSPGELRMARYAGFPQSRTSFTCSSVSEEELQFAARNAGIVHLDSLHQLEVWGRLKLGRTVSLRINQGIGAGHHEHVITSGPESKFGIDVTDIGKARELASRHGLVVTGIQQHIGSHVLDAALFASSMRELLHTAAQFPQLAHVDFGGGFGVPYIPKEKRLDLASLGKEYRALTRAFNAQMGRTITYAFEPGRYVIAESGTLLVSVTDIKTMPKHVFVGVNSGMNHLIRHAMYGSYHHIENLSSPSTKKVRVTVAGNICESGDVFAAGREIAMPQIGDILAIRTAGAYGMSMASTYNLRTLPKEVLIQGKKVTDISFSREAFLVAHAG